MLVVDGDAVPEAAKHPGEIVAEQQRVQREDHPTVEDAQVVHQGGTRVEHPRHAGPDLQHRVLVEAARARGAATADQRRQAEVVQRLAHGEVGQQAGNRIADAAAKGLQEGVPRAADAVRALAHQL